MSAAEADQLARDVATALAAMSDGSVSITLDHDADVLDLTLNVDVRVGRLGWTSYRDFSIATPQVLGGLVQGDEDGVWCTGGPLCIVRQITGRTVVSAVLRYLRMEAQPNA
jgi:hypothetical protein